MSEITTRRDDDRGSRIDRPQDHELRRSVGLGQLAKREELRTRWIGRPDGKRSHLRALLKELDATVAALEGRSAALDAVRDAVRELAAVLDLGAEPEVVPCPVCGRSGFRGATSCGFCWTSLRAAD
jgi:hypothetical protein